MDFGAWSCLFAFAVQRARQPNCLLLPDWEGKGAPGAE